MKNIQQLAFYVILLNILAGCMAKNTITDPLANAAVAACSGTDCVNVQLGVDTVQNINYTCGSGLVVRNVTDNVGMASCPNGYPIQYFIKSVATGATTSIALGSSLVSASKAGDLVRLTPNSFFPDATTAVNVSAVNEVRLLMSLSDTPYVTSAPVNQINISEAKKALLEKAMPNQTITANVFASEDTFMSTFQPWFNALGPNYTVVSYADAQAQLERGMRVIKAGLYYGQPVANFNVNNTSTGTNLGMSGQSTSDSTKQVNLALYALTDRDGYTIGNGLDWSGVATSTQASYALYLDKDFQVMTPAANNVSMFDMFTGRVQNFNWGIAANGNMPTGTFNMTSGQLINDYVLAGGEALYKQYNNISATNTAAIDSNKIGGWTINNSTDKYTGFATLLKPFAVDNFLDPAVWRTKDTVASGKQYVFPLHATLTFYYGGNGSAAVAGCPTQGCQLNSGAAGASSSLGITVLANGNIISDLNQDCSSVNGSLVDAQGFQEYRIGTVRTAYTNAQNDYFVSFALLLSGGAFGEWNGIQIGTDATAPKSKLNIKGVIEGGNSPTLNITDSSTAATLTTGTSPAQWGNVYNLYHLLRKNYVTGQKQTPTATDVDKGNKAQGIVIANVSSCYPSVAARTK